MNVDKFDRLAPPGCIGDPRNLTALDAAFQAIADERSRINTETFRELRLRRSNRELGPFLRRLAAHPERVLDGRFYGLKKPECGHLFDHIRLYTQDRKPYAAIFHPYGRLDTAVLKSLIEWSENAGLDLIVDADSEYYPGVTLRIVLVRKGGAFGVRDMT